MGTYAEQLSDFVSRLKFSDIPVEVIDKAKLHLLDIIGISLACTELEYAKIVSQVMREQGGKPECTVIGFGDLLPVSTAALINGSLAHGMDFDDTHLKSGVHVSASVVPASLAVGEREGVSGKDALTAMVAGWEVNSRLGMAAPFKFHARGLHPTSICGTFAATLLAGKILGLDSNKLASAMGIAGSQASGSMEFFADGSWVKRIHGGWAAHCGIISALLAQQGFTGPHTILEGRNGLYRSLLGEGNYDLEKLTTGLGRNWETMDIDFKPYPCCHANHASIECALFLKHHYDIDPDQIAEVECKVGKETLELVCEPVEVKLAPPTTYGAQFSLNYTVAVALSDGRVGIREFSEEKIKDPNILELARKVKYELDPAFSPSLAEGTYPGYVKAIMKNGKSYEYEIKFIKGMPQNPLTEQDVKSKFMANATSVVPEEQARKIISLVDKVDEISSVKHIVDLYKIE